MKKMFDSILNDKVLHLETYRFAILFYRSNCYLATGRKVCDANKELLNTNKIVIDSQGNDAGHHGRCGKS